MSRSQARKFRQKVIFRFKMANTNDVSRGQLYHRRCACVIAKGFLSHLKIIIRKKSYNVRSELITVRNLVAGKMSSPGINFQSLANPQQSNDLRCTAQYRCNRSPNLSSVVRNLHETIIKELASAIHANERINAFLSIKRNVYKKYAEG